jgi:hypothetical protein
VSQHRQGQPRTKNPHYLPQTYLRAWANEGSGTSARRAASTGPVRMRNGGRDSLSPLNNLGARWRDNLVDTGILTGEDRRAVALFAGFQIARTREHAAQTEFIISIADEVSECPISRESVRPYLRERHLGFDPEVPEVEAAWNLANYLLRNGPMPTRDELLGTSLALAVNQLAPRLEAMFWTVEKCRRPILMTGDRSVMYWRPPSHRDEFEGVGLLGAEEVRLPLTPPALLIFPRHHVASPLVRVEPERFDEVNRTTAAQCYEFVVATVSQSQRLSALNLKSRRPALRFNLGPGYSPDEFGRQQPIGDIIHAWVPSPSA